MMEICAFCLAKNRNLITLDDKLFQLIYLNLHSVAQYIGYLQSSRLLAACWECIAHLRSMCRFMSIAADSIQVFREYLESSSLNTESYSRLSTSTYEAISYTLEDNDNVKTEDKGYNNRVILSVNQDSTQQCNLIENYIQKEFKLDLDRVEEKESNKEVIEVKLESQEALDDNYVNMDAFCDDNDDDDDNKMIGDDEPAGDVNSVASICKKRETKQERWSIEFLTKEDAEKRYRDECDDTVKKKWKNEDINGKLSCDICSAKFRLQEHLMSHSELHYILYRCKLCTNTARTLANIRQHVDNEHEHSCKRCKSTFQNGRDLIRHRTSCTTYKCPHCPKSFKHNPSYYAHMKTHRTTDTLYCSVCDTHFKNSSWFKQHFFKSLKHVSRDDFKHVCEHCGQKFITAKRLQEHIDSIHLKNGTFKCEMCPKVYVRQNLLIRHKALKHNVGNFNKNKDKICDVCGKGFTSNHLLNNHMRSHTGERPFACQYCPATFAQSGTLYTHNKVVHNKRISKTGHAESERYTCDVCHKDFGTEAKRRTHHEFYHLKNSKFTCSVCDKNFISSTSLKNHNATRHGLISNKSYTCETCGKNFTTASARCQHKKTHNTERGLKCKSCEASFHNTGALYMHYKLKHLKLKRNDRVKIKNLCKLDEEIIVSAV